RGALTCRTAQTRLRASFDALWRNPSSQSMKLAQHEGALSMSLTVRRVVTGHDANGNARVVIDEIARNVAATRPGANAAVIWTSESFPVNNDGNADTSGRQVGTTLDNGVVFRVVSFGPGVAPRNHRTDSI